jgi:Ca-activated chloride channel homolog
MKTRIMQPAPATRTEFGLVAWLEQTRVILPLKGVECRFAVCGDLLEVEMDQIFHQNNPQPLDCLYSFPLPGDAAVYRCEMHVNGRVIRAKVEEVKRAREIFQEQKAAGRRAALVEMERQNLFTLSLGNVQGGDLVVIRLAYFQTLTRLEDWTSFSILFCPGVRYIPGAPLLRAPSGRGVEDDTDQVPDASRISPPRLDRLHPDAAYLSIEGKVEQPHGEVRDLSSPSHLLLVRDGDKAFRVTLADKAAVPDSDFVVRWTELKPKEVAPTGWVLKEDGQSYALLRLVAPETAETEDKEGQDIYFLVDRSGSMEGMKWQKAVQAFREFLKVLGPADRVWATFFENDFRNLAEKPLPAQALLADRSVARLEELGASGGTELRPALEHVLEQVAKHSKERRASLLLITDGQVGNEAEIVRLLKGHAGLRLHAFGIDTAVNDAFLKTLAAQQRGTCHLVTPQDDIAGAVSRLGARLRRPVLTNLELADGWGWAGTPARDLHAGEILSVPVRSTGLIGHLGVKGRTVHGQIWEHDISLEERPLAALRLLWARQQIEHHLAQGERDQALALAKKHNLICDGAAFIAWDEAERVTVSAPESLLYQPAMEVRAARAVMMTAQPCATQLSEDMATLREPDAFRLSPPSSARRFLDRLRGKSPSVQLELTADPENRLARIAARLGASRQQAAAHLLEELIGQLERFLPEDLCWQMLELICEWLLEEPAQVEPRLDRTKGLADGLTALAPLPAEKGHREFAARLREWVEANIAPSSRFRADFLQALAHAERVLGVHVV